MMKLLAFLAIFLITRCMSKSTAKPCKEISEKKDDCALSVTETCDDKSKIQSSISLCYTSVFKTFKEDITKIKQDLLNIGECEANPNKVDFTAYKKSEFFFATAAFLNLYGTTFNNYFVTHGESLEKSDSSLLEKLNTLVTKTLRKACQAKEFQKSLNKKCRYEKVKKNGKSYIEHKNQHQIYLEELERKCKDMTSFTPKMFIKSVIRDFDSTLRKIIVRLQQLEKINAVGVLKKKRIQTKKIFYFFKRRLRLFGNNLQR